MYPPFSECAGIVHAKVVQPFVSLGRSFELRCVFVLSAWVQRDSTGTFHLNAPMPCSLPCK